MYLSFVEVYVVALSDEVSGALTRSLSVAGYRSEDARD